jgi:N-acetylglucosamine kinase-like BadF-type ATPase
MTPLDGSLRGVEIRLLEPVPKLDGKRLDVLLGHSSTELARVHYMLMVLAANPIELQQDQWLELYLPHRSGPSPRSGSDAVIKHLKELQHLCHIANLPLTVKPWRLGDGICVDTRTLVHLTEALGDAVRQRDLARSLSLIDSLAACAPQLKEDSLPATWPLATLIAWVGDRVPQDVDPGSLEAEDYRRRAMEVTGLGKLKAAIRSAKCELPRRVFESLLDEERFDEAAGVLAWIAPAFARSSGLTRQLRDRATATGRMPDVVKEPTWVGISSGPSETVIAAPAIAEVVSEVSVAVGLGGTMSAAALASSAGRVMDELSNSAGRDVRNIVVGCAGFDPADPRPLLHGLAEAAAHRHLRSDLWVANDGDLLLFAPPILGSGVALVADRGSVVVGRNPDGTTMRRGGDEWLLADVGSGYEIAVHALRQIHDRVDRCINGEKPTAEIESLVVAARHTFGVPSPPDEHTGTWCRHVMKRLAREQAMNWDKSLIASFAVKVLKLADEGNRTARSVVEHSAEKLGEHLAEMLTWHSDEQPRIVIVGFLCTSDVYFDALTDGARKRLLKRPAKLNGLSIPATTAAVDARVQSPAILFAEVARMLDTSQTELSPAEVAVVRFLRDRRSRIIVDHLPRT